MLCLTVIEDACMASLRLSRWLPRIRGLMSHVTSAEVNVCCGGCRLSLSHHGIMSSSPVYCSKRTFIQSRGIAAGIAQFNGFVEIPLEDGRAAVCNTTWLRENCRCSQCYTSETSQRKIQFHRMSDPKAFTIDTITRHSSHEDHLTVRWADGHQSVYTTKWIKHMVIDSRHSRPTEKFLWNRMTMAEIIAEKKCHATYEALLYDKQTPKLLLNSLVRYGIGFIDDCPQSLEATVKVAEKVSYLQTTFYGKSWEFSNVNMDFKDTAYTNEEIVPHNDGTYFYDPPGLQVFHCLEHHGSGGETMLIDGFNCAEILRSQSPDLFRVLLRTRLCHDFADPQLKNRNQETVLRADPVTDEMEWIRYNPYDRSAYSTVTQGELPEMYAALASLAKVLEDPGNECRVKLRPGTVLFIDNWRVLHGRCSFTGTRRLCGCYISRDAWVREARTQGLL